MNLKKFLDCLLLIFLLSGCASLGFQFNPASQSGSGSGGSGVYSSGTVQPQLSDRAQYIWENALQGLTMGGAIAGPYGAGGGLVIGIIAGLFTANAHETQIANQIQAEQAKDKDLEAKVEQELENQRKLEAQLSVTNVANTAAMPQPAIASATSSTNTAPVDFTPSGKINGATVGKVNGTTVKRGAPVAVPSVDKENLATHSGAPFKNVEVRDINADGVPDVWTYYNPTKPGEIVRQEEATHCDGRVDSWSYFKDGKLVKREVDTKGKGIADTVYFYENEKIVREDHYQNGGAHASSRTMYVNGRRTKVEEDNSGSGRMDHWIYYDATQDNEIIVKDERDLNGDGSVDIWSYYENGRLARRDLNAAGLELLSDHDQAPTSSTPPQPALRPQLAKEIK
ncbi:MAG TPA: hypothetical protein VIB79_16650 [Candidatus Binatia bacterium]|jgi:antitoxin component YwqK of YwqJK toxin-antitoxin module